MLKGIMGHNVSSSKVVVQPKTSGFVDIRQTENGIHNSASVAKSNLVVANDSYAKTFRRIKECNVKVDGDSRLCDITGCCFLADGCLVLSDFSNKRLKKISSNDHVSFIDLPDQPSDVCCLGKTEQKVVVCGSNRLHFVSVKGKMKLSKSVTLTHTCNGITCHGDHLYVVDNSSVMKYKNNGEKREMLYTGSTSSSAFCHITASANGTKLYITDERSGLLTIDNSGKMLATLTDQELKEAQGVCVDSDGNVLVSGFESDTVIKVDSNGKKKLGTVIQDCGDISDPKCMCIDSHNSKMYVGQWNDKLAEFHIK